MCKNSYFCIYHLYTIFVNLLNDREGITLKTRKESYHEKDN